MVNNVILIGEEEVRENKIKIKNMNLWETKIINYLEL